MPHSNATFLRIFNRYPHLRTRVRNVVSRSSGVRLRLHLLRTLRDFARAHYPSMNNATSLRQFANFAQRSFSSMLRRRRGFQLS